jgi:hypothetical protein
MNKQCKSFASDSFPEDSFVFHTLFNLSLKFKRVVSK